jgi:hypothetical protein
MSNTTLIVPAGTQIVLLNDVRILHENRLLPNGAKILMEKPS